MEEESTLDMMLRLWWGKLIVAVICGAITVVVFIFFHRYETTGEGGRIPIYIAIFYYIGGKWTASAPFALATLGLLLSGIKQLRTGEEE